MSWNSIVGQHRVKKILTLALEHDRLAHAYLFVGQEGTGKGACAIELAKTMNCVRRGSEACDRCDSCARFTTLQHPNLHLVFPLPVGKNEKHGDSPLAKLSEDEMTVVHEEVTKKAANPYHRLSIPRANSIKINSVREIRRESSLTMIEKGKRVFVILDAELMTEEATNALLKTLEEPQSDTLLVLTSSRPDKLLPTIISRCQLVPFELSSDEDIQSALTSREHTERSEATLIARVAQGSYGRALLLMNGNLHERRAESVDLLRTSLYKSKQELLSEIDRLSKKYEKHDVIELLSMLELWFRDAMRMSIDGNHSGGMQDDETLKKFIAHHPGVDIAAVVGRIDDAISLLHKNAYIPLVLLTLSVNLRRQILISKVHSV